MFYNIDHWYGNFWTVSNCQGVSHQFVYHYSLDRSYKLLLQPFENSQINRWVICLVSLHWLIK